eukprot:gene3538-14142_t
MPIQRNAKYPYLTETGWKGWNAAVSDEILSHGVGVAAS